MITMAILMSGHANRLTGKAPDICVFWLFLGQRDQPIFGRWSVWLSSAANSFINDISARVSAYRRFVYAYAYYSSFWLW